jgi:hypothetical protein
VVSSVDRRRRTGTDLTNSSSTEAPGYFSLLGRAPEVSRNISFVTAIYVNPNVIPRPCFVTMSQPTNGTGGISLAEEIARQALGMFQFPVREGIGPAGVRDALVGIVTKTAQPMMDAGELPGPVIVEYVSASAVKGRQGLYDCGVTAHHLVAGYIELHSGQVAGGMHLWCLPARRFLDLDDEGRMNLNALLQSGAVRVLRYKSLIEDLGMAAPSKTPAGMTLLTEARNPSASSCETMSSCSWFNSTDVLLATTGLDAALLQLAAPVSDLPAQQPQPLFEEEVEDVSSYFRSHPDANVYINMEGMGESICKTGVRGNDRYMEVSQGFLARMPCRAGPKDSQCSNWKA